MDVSRRDLLKGGVVLAAGAAASAAVGMACCASDNASSSAGETASFLPETWDYEADVVVLGFGVAGATAATTAERAGASVIVVERDTFDSRLSNTRMSGGLIHCPDGDGKALRQYLRCMLTEETCRECLKESTLRYLLMTWLINLLNFSLVCWIRIEP